MVVTYAGMFSKDHSNDNIQINISIAKTGRYFRM